MEDHESSSRRAARLVAAALRRRPGLLLGLATGQTPTRAYAHLAAARARRPALFRHVRILKLDEWLGLPMDHPSTCETYLRENVLGPWGVAASRYRGFQSRPRSAAAECARLGRWLERHGPMDLCVLGLGENGHLLLNEPGTSLVPAPTLRAFPSRRAAIPCCVG
jgi:galactosamine-6-phosphate isomerase